MSNLRDQAFKLDREYALHIRNVLDVPCVTARGLRHRQQKILIEIIANTYSRGADAALRQTLCLRYNLICIGQSDICQTIGDKQDTINSAAVQMLAHLHSATNPGLVQS